MSEFLTFFDKIVHRIFENIENFFFRRKIENKRFFETLENRLMKLLTFQKFFNDTKISINFGAKI